jgi:hypothetical protein
MTATTSKENIDKIIEENVERLSKKYNNSYERVYGIVKLIEGDLKIIRSKEFKSNKDIFYKKVYSIANIRLYTEQQFKLKKEAILIEEYIK